MGGSPLRVQVVGENYIMIDLKGIPMDPVDAIIKLEVIK